MSIATIDLGGYFVKGLTSNPLAPALSHAAIAPLFPVPLAYALHAELDGICVFPMVDDQSSWTSEHLELATALHRALGRSVVACAFTEKGGYYEAFVAEANERRLGSESPFPFVVASKLLGVSMDRLLDLLEGPNCDPNELASRIAQVVQDEQRLYPGRRRMTLYVPDGVAGELAAIATARGTDVGMVVWCGWEAAKPASYQRWTKKKGPAARPPPEMPVLDAEMPRSPLVPTKERTRLSVWVPDRVIREIEDNSDRLGTGTGSVFATAWELGRARVPM